MKRYLIFTISILFILGFVAACDDNSNNSSVCQTGETQNGTTVCGLNNEGVLIQNCDNGQWVDSTDCTGTDECTNDSTQVGETACNNDTGFLIQDCTDGMWVDSANCSVGGCVEDATQVGTTVCGLNDEGFIVQVCDASGIWNDTFECSGTDICVNGASQEGTTVCNGTGVLIQDCNNGQWVDSANCTVGGCVEDATQVGTTVCGLNNEGFIVQVCDASGIWNDTFECSGTDICVNGTTQDGTTVCNGTGVLIQDCNNGQWVDSANCTVGGCTPDATQIGTTTCGLNDEGFYVQLCDITGQWNDTAECTGTDICVNSTTDATVCGDGNGIQNYTCTGGTWVENGSCVCNSTYHWDGTTCVADIIIGWCDVVSPLGYTTTASATEMIYAQVYATQGGSQVTASGTEIADIDAQVCYDDNGTEVCVDAVYNPSCASCGNNDEYMAGLSIDATGDYTYYYKFSGDMGATWTTCDSTFTATITQGSTMVFPPNGDFEAWTLGAPDFWTTIDSGLAVTEENTIKRNGAASMSVAVLSGTSSQTDFRQTITVVPNITYDVSVWVYHPTGTHLKARLYADGYGAYSDDTTLDSWQQVTGTVTPTANSIEVGLRFYDQSGWTAGEIVYIDDYTVVPQ